MMEKENKQNNAKGKWGIWVIIGLIVIYIVNGIIFSFIIYKKYPDGLAEGKKYPDQQKYTVIMSKIYPYVTTWVNWQPIWVQDYYKQLGFIRHFSEKTQQEIPSNSQLQNQVLDQMIDIKLLKQQAKKHKISISKKEVDEAFQKIVDENQGEKTIDEVLKELYNMTEKDFKKLIEDQLLKQKIQDELFVRVRAKHILVKDEGKAKEVLEKVKKEEKSFEDLAKEFSEDVGSRENGGDLNWFGRGMMVEEFEKAVFALESGKVTEKLVKTDFGYHIIKLEEKKGEIDKSYLEWFKEIKDNSKIFKWIKVEVPENKDKQTIQPDEQKPDQEKPEEKKENEEDK